MLTAEIIRANTTLSTLSDDQVTALGELYKNQFEIDHQKNLKTITGELHGRYDKDVYDVIGKPRPDGVKTHEYVKSVLQEQKERIAELEKLSKGGDEAIKAELERTKMEFEAYKSKSLESADAQLRHKFETTAKLAQDHEATIAKLQGSLSEAGKMTVRAQKEAEEKIVKLQTEFAFTNSLMGLKFKPSIGDVVANTLVDAEKSKILATYTPEVVERDGKQTIQFRSKTTNEIALNPANFQNPYTPGELLQESLSKLEIIDKGVQRTGTGSTNGGGQSQGVTIEAVRSAKTKVEADKAIEQYLAGQGVTKQDADFNAKFIKLRQENNVSQLP